MIQISPFCGFWRSLEASEHLVSLFILAMDLPQCLQLILYACQTFSQSEQESRRENKSGFPFRLRAFKSCLQTIHLPGQLALSLACRKGRAGVGSLCLVLERVWELAELGALAPCTEIAKCITGRSVQPHLSRTWATPCLEQELGMFCWKFEDGLSPSFWKSSLAPSYSSYFIEKGPTTFSCTL